MQRRRTMIFGSSAAILSGAPAWSAPLQLDLKNQQHIGLVFRKLSYAMNGELTYWALRGTRYGLVDLKLTPLWTINIATWFAVADIDSSTYEVTTMGSTFYTDVETGALMETVRNPYNGKDYKIPYFAPRPFKFRYRYDTPPPRAGRAGYKVTQAESYGPAWVDGEDIHVISDIELRGAPNDPAKPHYQVKDIATYTGAFKDVVNPDVPNPPARLASNDINTFPDYFEMPEGRGTFFSHGVGRKIFRYDDMPENWRSLMAQRYPDIARDPAGALKG